MKNSVLQIQKVLFALLWLAVAVPAAGQSGVVRQYSALSGDSMLVRTDNSTFVTCCNTTGWRSCFVVDNGIDRRRFFTTQAPSGIHITDSGYMVRDMQLVGGTYWFAGYKWIDTGIPVYTIDGQAYNRIDYKAVIGRFNTADVLSGSGNYGVVEVPGLHHIERLAVIGDNVTAIGVKLNGDRQLVELALEDTNNNYTLHRAESSSSYEVLMDVVAAGNKVVLLSRYKESWGFMRSTYYFGLRYGSAGNMVGTSGATQYYDVYDAYDWRIGFPSSTHPVRLASTNNGNGVVVSYIAQRNDNPNSLYGKYVLLHIASENANTADVFLNMYDTCHYTEVADTCPAHNAPCKVVEDSSPLITVPGTTLSGCMANKPYTSTTISYSTTCSTAKE